MNKLSFATMAALVCLAGSAAAQETPRRLILLVGDGVGLPHWSAARLSSSEALAVNRLPVLGLMDTRCACNRTTDSAAGATAFATGHRTAYGMVGTAPDSTPQTSVLDEAEARGLSTGLVTTSHITDATPAAFGADWFTRYDRERIAAQYAEKDIEVLLGGGTAFFERRSDGRNLTRELARRYTVVKAPAEFETVSVGNTERLLGLFADSVTEPAGRPTLPAMAQSALAILDRNPRGFFLLLETEDTDEIAHGNRPIPELVTALRELDATVAVALEYQQRHPETLIVVLGDHETGGLAIQVQRDLSVSGGYTTTGHSAESTLIFAGGPGSHHFGHWLDNEQVGQLLRQYVRGELEARAPTSD